MKKISEEVKLLFGRCSICNTKKSITVSDNTKSAESLGNLLKNLGKEGLHISKTKAKKF